MKICPICRGPAFDDPFACLLDSSHNELVIETIDGKNEKEIETYQYLDEFTIKIEK